MPCCSRHRFMRYTELRPTLSRRCIVVGSKPASSSSLICACTSGDCLPEPGIIARVSADVQSVVRIAVRFRAENAAEVGGFSAFPGRCPVAVYSGGQACEMDPSICCGEGLLADRTRACWARDRKVYAEERDEAHNDGGLPSPRSLDKYCRPCNPNWSGTSTTTRSV